MIIRPSLNLDFRNARQLGPLTTLARATTKTYCDRNGVLRTASVNQPCFDFYPAAGSSRGLSIHEQRTNLLTYSDQFDNAAWTKTGLTVTPNIAIAPDGTLTADRLVEGTGTEQRRINRNVTVPSGTMFAWSIHVASDAARKGVTLYISSSAGGGIADFDLLNGTKSTALVSGGAVVASDAIPFSDGTYRLWIAVQTTAAVTSVGVNCYFSNVPADGNAIYTGDGTSGVSAWGAQLEEGAIATPYIPTTSAQVTRSADVVTLPTAAWFNQAEGTFYVEADCDSTAADSTILAANDGTQNAQYDIRFAISSLSGRVRTSGDNEASLPGLAALPVAGSLYKCALAYKANDASMSVNGSEAVTDTTVALPTGITTLTLGSRSGANWLNGHIRRFAYFPRRLLDAELQSITL